MRIIAFVFFISFLGCQGVSKSGETDKNEVLSPSPASNSASTLTLSYNTGKTYKVSDRVTITFSSKVGSIPDSMRLAVDGIYRRTYIQGKESIVWETAKELPGIRSVLMTAYWGTKAPESATISIELVSDMVPIKYTYKVKKSWPHNKRAYTQGLEFSDGVLYEGTGQYGESMLCKLDLLNNEILQSLNLPADVFGEGITILNDKIFQLTWRSHVGFVYEKSTLNRLYEFNYPTEGWGLCNNGKELMMSDGTETIYFLDAEYFQEIRRIQVYNDKGPVKSLNELEYINQEIFANVYGSDLIVVIDPQTGKVKKQIDLTGLLDKRKIKDPIDVLNGIAWNASTQQLIVTGKWWPELYEIELVEKK
jgi:glutamine cyclotransferase